MEVSLLKRVNLDQPNQIEKREPSLPQNNFQILSGAIAIGKNAVHLSHDATFSPAQVASTFWRSRTAANFLPLTRISAVSGRVL